MERKEEGVMIKELLFALNHAEPMGKKPWQAPKEPVELKPPKRTVQKETKKEPQKLSNKLLDMFQPKKSKPAVDLNAITPTKELTHVSPPFLHTGSKPADVLFIAYQVST